LRLPILFLFPEIYFILVNVEKGIRSVTWFSSNLNDTSFDKFSIPSNEVNLFYDITTNYRLEKLAKHLMELIDPFVKNNFLRLLENILKRKGFILKLISSS
jgi:hypothetical protein